MPRRWRRYQEISRILLRHGFGFLLEAARPRRGPLRLPDTLPPARHLRLALEELGPTFIKLGQILSTRPDLLPSPLIAELVLLQDRVAPFPFAQVRRRVEEELGAPLEVLFASLEETPLAAASLSQVHAATLPTGEEVVVKVQRPGIEEVIALDLDILRRLAQLLESEFPQAELYDPVGIVEEFAHTLNGELDFVREGRNAERFRRNFADFPYLHIPRVCWERTTRRVLTLERVRGIRIDDIAALEAAGLDRHRVALHATEVVMREVLVDGFFHADPHPGNFFVMPGEVIAAMDFGMVGRLSPKLREDLIRLLAAAVQRDAGGLVEQLLRMSLVEQGVDRAGLRQDLEHLLQRYAGRPLKEVRAREIMEEAMPIAFRRRLRLPNELWLLGKMLGMLEGVGLQLDPEFDPFAVAQPYARRFLEEIASPAALGRRAGRSLGRWGRLFLELPEARKVLAQLREGNFSLGWEWRRMERPLAALDRLTLRLALGILAAGLLVASAILLRPLLETGVGWGWLLFALGVVALLVLGAALLWSLATKRGYSATPRGTRTRARKKTSPTGDDPSAGPSAAPECWPPAGPGVRCG